MKAAWTKLCVRVPWCQRCKYPDQNHRSEADLPTARPTCHFWCRYFLTNLTRARPRKTVEATGNPSHIHTSLCDTYIHVYVQYTELPCHLIVVVSLLHVSLTNVTKCQNPHFYHYSVVIFLKIKSFRPLVRGKGPNKINLLLNSFLRYLIHRHFHKVWKQF